MKYVPIVVRVPGSNGDELSLTPSEARMLVMRLEKRLAEFDVIKAHFGLSAARKSNKRPYRKLLRKRNAAAATNEASLTPADRTEGQEL
jgi:hypothetical protein